MKNIAFSRYSIATFFAMLAVGLFAQVKGTKTDERFANTLVVFKDSNSLDVDILAAVGNDFGLSDVVRITVAPPKTDPVPQSPAPENVETEEPFLAVQTGDSVANAAPPPSFGKINPPRKNLADSSRQTAGAGPQKRVAVSASPKSGLGKSSAKSGGKKQSAKKSGLFSFSQKLPKARKKGKQRYGCYQF